MQPVVVLATVVDLTRFEFWRASAGLVVTF